MTDPINFRALCVNLLDCLEKADWPPRYRNVFGQWASVARAALAEPADAPAAVADGPSDEELRDLWSWAAGQDQGPWPTQQHAFARAVLARWGQPLTPPADRHAAPVPVPVSERLPGPEDCDAEERCWLLAPRWILPPCEMTHWLPAHALPLPALDQTVTGEHQ